MHPAPWQGKRVGYLGDSITDPNCYGDKIKKYWDFLQEWLGITPYVYGISGSNGMMCPASRATEERTRWRSRCYRDFDGYE